MRLLLLSFAIVFVSCKKDDPLTPTLPTIPNQEEVITTLNYTLTAPNGDVVLFSFKDVDGDGGNAPVIVNGALDTNLTYSGKIELLNETVSPAEDITEEVKEEGDEHQIFYQFSNPDLGTTYTDADANGKPIGVSTQLITKGTFSSTLTITLRHTPDKNASDVASGDISNAGGETDIEVTFDVDVK
ncbi:MAG: type 1 periplasmic binding fold superfamily protein [Salibacteraceae bacterium]|nr:type 1 periplasmic binding fold superfamily protein [Salibacteraceae bacterium]|tara:strand:- start:80959 stop:81516 length:558 start_codon:yes stop_codon:yes gene_type:complete